ncbi:MAG TPA: hypothetical protein ENG83_11070 [Nitrospirae bacterium]|nr:hypothetical protein [Nitrospirota bacterium]HDZ00023.1 hypothetical protein [Nitrospirota bacterium]
MIARYLPPERVPKKVKVITDTSDFFRVDYDDVVVLDGRPYLIRNYEREGRFSIDEQPKFWVKRAIDLEDGSLKIIKMVFSERFRAKVGDMIFECVRSSKKEARILDLVRGHPNFMHGFSTRDSTGNIIRIIDYIPGITMDILISRLGRNHEDYFYNYFPSVFVDYIELVEAIAFLHRHGEKHGDIRRDHIIKDKRGGRYRWIDFDFNYWHKENMFGYDLFGLGNVLVYLAGRGDVTTQYLGHNNQAALQRLTIDDMNIIFNNRVVNLKKIYPYIPDTLNFVLLHFSAGAEVFYDDTGQLLDDLNEARDNLNVAHDSVREE